MAQREGENEMKRQLKSMKRSLDSTDQPNWGRVVVLPNDNKYVKNSE